jgi:hypothetical protein
VPNDDAAGRVHDEGVAVESLRPCSITLHAWLTCTSAYLCTYSNDINGSTLCLQLVRSSAFAKFEIANPEYTSETSG